MPAPQHQTIADFLAAQSPEARTAVDSLRALIIEADPRVVEIVKWNSPTFTLEGEDRLTINVSPKGAVRLVLHRGARVAEAKGVASTLPSDPGGVLTWHSDIRASMPAEVDPVVGRAIVHDWLCD